jgi:hypothetical protein
MVLNVRPEQVLLQGSDEALGDAIALGFAHEGRRSFDAQTFDLVLEIAGHVIGAMIVTQLEPTSTLERDALSDDKRLRGLRDGRFNIDQRIQFNSSRRNYAVNRHQAFASRSDQVFAHFSARR